MSIVMYDSIDVSQIPASATAVAGYVGGRWPTFASLTRRFPSAHHLSIAIAADENADALDIENGDATVSQAAGWYARQKARGLARPCFYASASLIHTDLVPAMTAAGITRSSVRLWSAHYGDGAHVCGPAACRLTQIPMDATQWTSNALGRNLDESLVADDFFGTAPSWQEAMMNALPTLQQGDRDTAGHPLFVHRVQVLTAGIGAWNNLGTITQVTADGAFGPATTTAVKRVQQFFGLTADGIVGPATYRALVTGSR